MSDTIINLSNAETLIIHRSPSDGTLRVFTAQVDAGITDGGGGLFLPIRRMIYGTSTQSSRGTFCYFELKDAVIIRDICVEDFKTLEDVVKQYPEAFL